MKRIFFSLNAWSSNEYAIEQESKFCFLSRPKECSQTKTNLDSARAHSPGIPEHLSELLCTECLNLNAKVAQEDI